MTGGLVKVTERVRGVVDGKVVVRRPGQLVTPELAEQLGITTPGAKQGPPKPPAGARPAKPKAKTRKKPAARRKA